MLLIHKALNKIKWDKRKNPEDYTVGYWDRIEETIIEIKLKDFLKEPIPLHRIRYLKRKEEIVWDRRTKTDKM